MLQNCSCCPGRVELCAALALAYGLSILLTLCYVRTHPELCPAAAAAVPPTPHPTRPLAGIEHHHIRLEGAGDGDEMMGWLSTAEVSKPLRSRDGSQVDKRAALRCRTTLWGLRGPVARSRLCTAPLAGRSCPRFVPAACCNRCPRRCWRQLPTPMPRPRQRGRPGTARAALCMSLRGLGAMRKAARRRAGGRACRLRGSSCWRLSTRRGQTQVSPRRRRRAGCGRTAPRHQWLGCCCWARGLSAAPLRWQQQRPTSRQVWAPTGHRLSFWRTRHRRCVRCTGRSSRSPLGRLAAHTARRPTSSRKAWMQQA